MLFIPIDGSKSRHYIILQIHLTVICIAFVYIPLYSFLPFVPRGCTCAFVLYTQFIEDYTFAHCIPPLS